MKTLDTVKYHVTVAAVECCDKGEGVIAGLLLLSSSCVEVVDLLIRIFRAAFLVDVFVYCD
jgi:hypothetical protein